MKKRILSALIAIGIGGPIILFLGPYALFIFTAIVLGACLYEFLAMLNTKKEFILIYLGITSGVIFLFVTMFLRTYTLPFIVLFFIGFNLYFLFKAKTYRKSIAPRTGVMVGKLFIQLCTSIFGVFFLSFFISYVPMLRTIPNGLKWIVLLMAIIWLGDTGAYFIGKNFGVTKFYPVISPKKTIEGALAGIGASFIAAVVCKFLFFDILNILDCFNLAVIGGFLGQLGDLTESFIKRSVNKKDSGNFMPGHGGMLDRFDGIIYSAPFFYLYAIVFF
jgi:phosphatidate cytidylyltransferase